MKFNYKKILIFTIAYIFLILLIGLWPFNFSPENNIELTADGKGILLNKGDIRRKFHAGGIIYSDDNITLPRNGASSEITFELLLKCRQVPLHQVSSIISFYNKSKLVFTLEQWHAGLLIRIPDLKSEKEKYKKSGVRDALPKDSLRLVSFSFGKMGLKFYINGKLQKHDKNLSINNAVYTKLGQLIIGNSITGKTPWNGELYQLDIYSGKNEYMKDKYSMFSHESTYNNKRNRENYKAYIFHFDNIKDNRVFDVNKENIFLNIPEKFKIFKKEYLSFKKHGTILRKLFTSDFIINILGFIPLGFLLCLVLINLEPHSNIIKYIMVTVSGFALSMFIELSQAHMVSRNSSLSDLIINTTGTILGIVLYVKTKSQLYYNTLNKL